MAPAHSAVCNSISLRASELARRINSRLKAACGPPPRPACAGPEAACVDLGRRGLNRQLGYFETLKRNSMMSPSRTM